MCSRETIEESVFEMSVGALGRNDALVIAFAVVGGIGCSFADAAPTALAWWNLVLRFAFGALLVLGASRAQRWTLIILGGVAASFSGMSVWTGLALLALVGAFASAFLDRRDKALGAAIGALAAQSLLRLPPNLFFGFSSLVTGVAVLVVLVSGYHYAKGRHRRWVRWSALGLGLASALCSLSLLFTFVNARPDAERGVQSAREGLQSVRAGDVPATLQALSDAQQAFGSASDSLDSMLALPGGLLPIASQHLASLRVASEQGKTLAAAASAAAASADVSSIAASRGRVDVEALRGMAPQLQSTAETIVAGREAILEAQNPWLVPQVADRLDGLATQLEETAPEALLAAQAARAVPRLLGVDGPQRYFVIFASPAESRELGGFIGSYGLVEANNGSLDKVASGRVLELYSIVEETSAALDHPDGYPDFFQRLDPVLFPQNLPGMPDLDTVARAVDDLFPQLEGAPIDGVLYIDPFAIETMLGLTGPITIPDLDRQLDSSNAADFLIKDQYVEFASNAERFDFLTKVLDATFAAFAQSDLPGPEELGRVLGPVARASRLQMTTFDEELNHFLQNVLLLNRFPAPDGDDFLAVATSNAAPNKLDAYMTRSINYDVQLDPASGRLKSKVRVFLTSVVPDGLPDYVTGLDEAFENVRRGENRSKVIVYSPHEIVGALQDGISVTTGFTREFGYNRYTLTPTVGPNETVQLVFDVEGQVDLDGGYRLTIPSQPVVNVDSVTVTVTTRGGLPGQTSFSLLEDTELYWELN